VNTESQQAFCAKNSRGDVGLIFGKYFPFQANVTPVGGELPNRAEFGSFEI